MPQEQEQKKAQKKADMTQTCGSVILWPEGENQPGICESQDPWLTSAAL